MTTQQKEYQRKYADIKAKMHTMVYGTTEYKTMNQLMNFYYKRAFDVKCAV